jgi:hypothetical protein
LGIMELFSNHQSYHFPACSPGAWSSSGWGLLEDSLHPGIPLIPSWDSGYSLPEVWGADLCCTSLCSCGT